MELAAKNVEAKIETIEVIGAEGGFQYAANLSVVAGHVEFLSGAADSKIIDDNLALVESSLGGARQLTKFQVAKTLHSDPDAGSHYGENQTERTSCRPKQEQTKQSEDGRNGVQHDDDLAMRQAVL